MTGLTEDIIATYELITEEYKRLQGHEPNHELLKYISSIKRVGNFEYTQDKKLQKEFLEKFADEKTHVLQMHTNYYIAMRRAVDIIEGIDREPKPPKQKSLGQLVRNLDQSVEGKEIPF
jgi:hypothetical protein